MKLTQIATIGEELALAFDSGKEIYLPFDMLRRACPCANCKGEPDAMGRRIIPKVEYKAGAFELKSFSQVGSYGVQLAWADQHNTGIYSNDYLMELAEIVNEA